MKRGSSFNQENSDAGLISDKFNNEAYDKIEIVSDSIGILLQLSTAINEGLLSELDIVLAEPLVSSINTVASNVVSINLVKDNLADINLLAPIVDDISIVADDIASVIIAANNILNIDIVADNIVDVNNVGSNISDVIAVSGNTANINTVVSDIVPNIVEILLADENAVTATEQAAIATQKAIDASNSETASLNSANASALSESNASTSESNANSSANSSLISAQASENSRQATEALLDTFDDRYLGAKAVAPTLDNDSEPLQDGALYYDTTLNALSVYDLGTTTWISLPVTILASLTDVELTSLSTDELLVWNGTKWVNKVLTKVDVSLDQVDNTSDMNKPVSTAQGVAIGLKADKIYVDTQSIADKARVNHTGTQTASTISDFTTTVNTIVGTVAEFEGELV